MTPSFAELERRLRARNTETEDSIRTRLGSARRELGRYETFDYIVFNDTAETAAQHVVDIIEAERAKMKRNLTVVQELLQSK